MIKAWLLVPALVVGMVTSFGWVRGYEKAQEKAEEMAQSRLYEEHEVSIDRLQRRMMHALSGICNLGMGLRAPLPKGGDVGVWTFEGECYLESIDAVSKSCAGCFPARDVGLGNILSNAIHYDAECDAYCPDGPST